MPGMFNLDEISSGYTTTPNAGGTSGSTVSDAEESSLTQFVAEAEGGLLACAYGEHLVGGFLIVHKYDAGPPPSSKLVVAGGEGVWDSVVTCWYAGDTISSSPDATTPGYHFYPGTISTSTTDPTQPVDSFLSSGLAYSGTAYLAVLLPESKSTEDRPDKIRWRAKCKKVYTYDVSGTPSSSRVYSVNPADIAVDAIRRYYEARYPDDETTVLAKLKARVNWDKYLELREYCAETISWNDGTTTRTIPRFECHVVFTGEVTLADALDAICATCATWWQDDGERITFRLPTDTDFTHHFSESNIVTGSFQVSPRDTRERINYVTVKFRDLDDPYLTETSTTAQNTALIQKVGKIASERAFPNMYRSQAQRLLARQLRLECDYPQVATFRATGAALHVMPGDFVTVSHSIPDWEYQRCLVLEATLLSAEKSADECEFTVQAITGEGVIYSDDDHFPVQPEVTP